MFLSPTTAAEYMLADPVQNALVSLEICQNGKKLGVWYKTGTLKLPRGIKGTMDVLAKDLLVNITDQLN